MSIKVDFIINFITMTAEEVQYEATKKTIGDIKTHFHKYWNADI